MSRRRCRFTVGARIAITIAAVVLISTVSITFAAYKIDRDGSESRFVNAALSGITADLGQATAAVREQPPSRYVQTIVNYINERDVPWTLVNSATSPPSGEGPSRIETVPAQFLNQGDVGRIRSQWTESAGTRVFAVGGFVTPHLLLVEFYNFAPAEQQLNRLRRNLIWLDAAGMALATLAGVLVARRVSRPVRRAAYAARRLGDGDLDTRIPVSGRDELADLAASFNQMAQRLSETLQELRAAHARQRRFVADVSHELRTPLAAMLAAGQTLDSPDPELGRRAGLLLGKQTRRMSALIDELLEISRFDAGQAALELEDVDLVSLARDAIHTVVPDSDVRLIQIGHTVARGDARRLHTVLRNLLANAVQHGAEPVDVIVSDDGDAVSVSVLDSGPGISPDLLPVIFDRFVRADSSRGTRTGGTGLGLAIAYENAQLHGATLTLTTRERTTFILSIPRDTPGSPPDARPALDLTDRGPGGQHDADAD